MFSTHSPHSKVGCAHKNINGNKIEIIVPLPVRHKRYMNYKFDVIVVGAGHAGCEAATAAANMGATVLLVTMDMNKIAQMSCNPAMGGIAKGQIVREIDALGGMSGRVSDATAIQFRMLNRSKGPAMWSPRAQIDRAKFIDEWRSVIENIPNITLWQDTVTSLLISDKGRCHGVRTELGVEFEAGRVVLTTGTFMRGLMHYGELMIPGGRCAEPASVGVSEQLAQLGHTVGRMKTGTPPRIDGRSVDWSLCTPQYGDRGGGQFSFAPLKNNRLKQRPCQILYTNELCHSVLRSHLDQSPLYNGQIESIGPRYCPSIETKIVNFAQRDRHQLFLEPEGETTNEYYLNGFSSSLPTHVQIEALQQIPALRNVQLFRPGYAIEYDFCDPVDLFHSLESRKVAGLFLAGQINGTTGYEEAAGQGLMAGINAVLSLREQEPLVLLRNEAYIGVLIDDLITKGVDEPYRMFTSRAEFRILLRQDNADERLTPYALKLGLADDERAKRFSGKQKCVHDLSLFVQKCSVKPAEINNYLEQIGEQPIVQSLKLRDLVMRPNLHLCYQEDENPSLVDKLPTLQGYLASMSLLSQHQNLRQEVLESAEIGIKYSGYIEREKQQAEKIIRLENIVIEDKFDYNSIESLPLEAREKLSKHRPKTIAQARRIPGINPNDIAILLVLMGR